jgi:hypothetical protein
VRVLRDLLPEQEGPGPVACGSPTRPWSATFGTTRPWGQIRPGAKPTHDAPVCVPSDRPGKPGSASVKPGSPRISTSPGTVSRLPTVGCGHPSRMSPAHQRFSSSLGHQQRCRTPVEHREARSNESRRHQDGQPRRFWTVARAWWCASMVPVHGCAVNRSRHLRSAWTRAVTPSGCVPGLLPGRGVRVGRSFAVAICGRAVRLRGWNPPSDTASKDISSPPPSVAGSRASRRVRAGCSSGDTGGRVDEPGAVDGQPALECRGRR